nr:nicotianamine synthase, S-adenosyl-L-methionine-dependent methyltransferase [Tanacetum cinerariifolium]
YNFSQLDIDSMENSMAFRLVSADHDLSQRMVFHTEDILDVTNELKDYDERPCACAFLYPVVDPNVLDGFNVLFIFHPDDDVINSVVIS